MVEETSAATHKLSAEADGLVRLISRFKVSNDAQVAVARQQHHQPVASPARRAVARVARAFGGNTAAAEQSWEEF
jgi:methyl-accepting chemotaxis protein